MSSKWKGLIFKVEILMHSLYQFTALLTGAYESILRGMVSWSFMGDEPTTLI